jgi:hypothetical protein
MPIVAVAFVSIACWILLTALVIWLGVKGVCGPWGYRFGRSRANRSVRVSGLEIHTNKASAQCAWSSTMLWRTIRR